MLKIAVASGKGGAGKTSVSAALIRYLGRGVVAADGDVDAANGAIALGSKELSQKPYYSGKGFRIAPDLCIGCGLCVEACRFEAIFPDGEKCRIEEPLCERCGVCADLCPEGAILGELRRGGTLMLSELPSGALFSHAELYPGEDTSGKLVSQVRRQAEEKGKLLGVDFMVIDSPPGIGCPVIASLSGVDLAVVVVEAGRSGLSDAERLIQLLRRMKIEAVGLINKTGIDEEIDDEARRLLGRYEIPLFGEIPFDSRFRRSTEAQEGWVDSNDPWVSELSRSFCRAIVETKRRTR